jgi:hypothetical protein
VAEGAIPLDADATHHRAAPPTEQPRAVLQLLDGEKEERGLVIVLQVMEEILDVGIIRGGRIRQIELAQAPVRVHPRFGRLGGGRPVESKKKAGTGCGAAEESRASPDLAGSGGGRRRRREWRLVAARGRGRRSGWES